MLLVFYQTLVKFIGDANNYGKDPTQATYNLAGSFLVVVIDFSSSHVSVSAHPKYNF